MKHYFVAQIKIHDPDEYDKYLENFDDIFSKFKGEYLAIDESPTLLEGNWDYTKSVLIKFGSKIRLRRLVLFQRLPNDSEA